MHPCLLKSEIFKRWRPTIEMIHRYKKKIKIQDDKQQDGHGYLHPIRDDGVGKLAEAPFKDACNDKHMCRAKQETDNIVALGPDSGDDGSVRSAAGQFGTGYDQTGRTGNADGGKFK